LQKRIKELEGQLKQKELSQTNETRIIEQRFNDVRSVFQII